MNLLFPSHFGYLRWQPSIWPKDVSAVILTETWHQRHFKAVVEHALSVPWGWIFSKTKVRAVAYASLILQPSTTAVLIQLSSSRQAGLDKAKNICKNFWFVLFGILIAKTTTMSNTNTFGIHHKNKREMSTENFYSCRTIFLPLNIFIGNLEGNRRSVQRIFSDETKIGKTVNEEDWLDRVNRVTCWSWWNLKIYFCKERKRKRKMRSHIWAGAVCWSSWHWEIAS